MIPWLSTTAMTCRVRIDQILWGRRVTETGTFYPVALRDRLEG